MNEFYQFDRKQHKHLFTLLLFKILSFCFSTPLKNLPRSLSRVVGDMPITLEFPSTCCTQNPTNYLHSYFVFSKYSTTFRPQWNNLVYNPGYVRRRWSYFFTCRLSYSKTRRIRLERLGYQLLTFCSFSSLAYFSLSLFKVSLKRYFGDQNKLLNLAGRAVKYGALNWLMIAHVLPVRCNEGFWSDTSLFARTTSFIVPCQSAFCY